MTAIGMLARAAFLVVPYMTGVNGHGYMYVPATRNVVAKEEGVNGIDVPGKPDAEYCAHCLNRNYGVCGYSESNVDYDKWLDSEGNPMPWESQATYGKGAVIQIKSHLWAHHGGHMEVKACPMGRASTQACFDQHPLMFVDDLAYGMPADINHPERGYFYGGQSFNDNGFDMLFKLPENLEGEQVLLQWYYITANSCTPGGYGDYFSTNNLPDFHWAPQIPACPDQLDSTGSQIPERFWNCAEVSITGEPSTSPPPTYSPVAVATDAPTAMPVQNTPAPNPTTAPVQSPPIGTDSDPKLVAYVGNWQSCPSASQLAQYTHIVIAFAVSYQWTPTSNLCNSECIIETPPTCGNTVDTAWIQQLQAKGKKVLLSFGGAGMGGSWASSNDDCWEYCFGREDYVIQRLTEISAAWGLDGIDIDYEYFYEDGQNGSGFNKGAEAQFFLETVTTGLKSSLPEGSLVVHAPMDIDAQPGKAYYEILKRIASSVDFLLPQYYNGITRPITDGIDGTGFGSHAALSHLLTMANDIYGGDTSKILFGFCIADCAGTGSNANGAQAAAAMSDLRDALGGCTGGAFFWVAEDDVGGSWSTQVKAVLDSNTCSSGPIPVPQPSPTLAPQPTPTIAPVPTTIPEGCGPCYGTSSGPCQKLSDGACWSYVSGTSSCPAGTVDCSAPVAVPTPPPSTLTPVPPPTPPPSTSAPVSPPMSTPQPSPTPLTNAPTITHPLPTVAPIAPTNPPSLPPGTSCGIKWFNCYSDPTACCSDYDCIPSGTHTSFCLPKAGVCIDDNGDNCIGSEEKCCTGYTCQGTEWWKTCTKA